MTEAEEIKAIEAKMKARRMPMRAFQKRAKVSASTWWRIKREDVIPNGATMRRIRAALEEVEGGDSQKDSAE